MREFYGPHTVRAMTGVRVRVSGPSCVSHDWRKRTAEHAGELKNRVGVSGGVRGHETSSLIRFECRLLDGALLCTETAAGGNR